MNKNYQTYIAGSIKLGLGFGVVILLARWVTGNTILSSPETLIKYGLAGGIGYSMMGAFALILFGLLAKIIRERYTEHQTIGDVLRAKLSPTGYWYMITLLLVTSFDSLFVQAMGAGILFHIISALPVFAGMLLFLLFCFLVGGIGGMQRIHQLAGVSVTFVFIAVIVIPVYFYIQEGVRPVYEGVRLYHPYLLYIKNTDVVSFIATAILIGFGQIIIDRATWQRIFILQKEKVRMAFTLAGLIWATIPLALSSLLMIIIFGRSYDTLYSLLFELVEKIQSTMLIVFFLLFCFSAISSAFSAELHAICTLLVKNVIAHFQELTNRERWKFSFLSSGIICTILLIAVSLVTPSPLELLFFFGNVYAAIIAPMLCIVLWKSRVPIIVPFASLLGSTGGYITLTFVENLTAIWVSFLLSTIICISTVIYHITFHKRKVSSLPETTLK
ncbi:hypothetical protein MUG87_04095 [Ectobacillus sp. JY-23]|uniref:hypothetical protein n=1 Tax=Ectobacillus sp. JY-23 TaxID=2933872 RepID=UPI001FF11C6D|nr:hypothetical protein [Ectobacillus sp. JY-23]UOY93317.1 hypothetical protein MUG87_04095 [Ectobacillus sp. JY-23]